MSRDWGETLSFVLQVEWWIDSVFCKMWRKFTRIYQYNFIRLPERFNMNVVLLDKIFHWNIQHSLITSLVHLEKSFYLSISLFVNQLTTQQSSLSTNIWSTMSINSNLNLSTLLLRKQKKNKILWFVYLQLPSNQSLTMWFVADVLDQVCLVQAGNN